MKAFEEARANAFLSDLKSDLRSALNRAGRAISDEDLDRQLAIGLPRGRRYFTREPHLARYAKIVMLQLGGWTENDHPQTLLKMLSSSRLPPERRLENLEIWSRSREAWRERRQRERR
jgi:hypothetical protein